MRRQVKVFPIPLVARYDVPKGAPSTPTSGWLTWQEFSIGFGLSVVFWIILGACLALAFLS